MEPGADKLKVSETFLVQNDTNKTFNDPPKARCNSICRREANGKAEVTISAPGGMPIRRPAEQTNQAWRVQGQLSGEARRDSLRRSLLACPTADTFSGKVVAARSAPHAHRHARRGDHRQATASRTWARNRTRRLTSTT